MKQLDLFDQVLARNEPPFPGFFEVVCIKEVPGNLVHGKTYWAHKAIGPNSEDFWVIIQEEPEGWKIPESKCLIHDFSKIPFSVEGWLKNRFKRVDDYETT